MDDRTRGEIRMNAELKKQAVTYFFSSLNSDEQYRFLKLNKIDYIFFGPQEKAHRQNDLTIPNTQLVYKNTSVQIYRVIR